jgi:hypothetical protein
LAQLYLSVNENFFLWSFCTSIFHFCLTKAKKRSNKKKCLVEILAAEGTEKQEENIRRGLYNQVLVAGLLKNLEIGSGDICFVQH